MSAPERDPRDVVNVGWLRDDCAVFVERGVPNDGHTWHALVLRDDMIRALDAADPLRQQGAELEPEVYIGGYVFRQSEPGAPIVCIYPQEPRRERVCTTHSGSPHQAIREALASIHEARRALERVEEGG